jgi:hypothetical protein
MIHPSPIRPWKQVPFDQNSVLITRKLLLQHDASRSAWQVTSY